jgi:hypothetical protein
MAQVGLEGSTQGPRDLYCSIRPDAPGSMFRAR